MHAPYSWTLALLAGLIVGTVATAAAGTLYILRSTGDAT